MMLVRRDFLKVAGSLIVYFSLVAPRAVNAVGVSSGLSSSFGKTPELDSWIRINADGGVSIFPGKSELGQGIQTSLAQIAAEELDVSMSRMRVAQVDTDHSPDEAYTNGSMSIVQSGSAFRTAAAEARQILIELAAEELSVTPDRINVDDGSFFVDGKAVDLDYWRVLGDKEFKTVVSGKAAPKSRMDYRLVGKAIERIDIPAKAFGDPTFIQDLHLPNMVHARIVRPPSPGRKLQQIKPNTVESMPGIIKIVRDGSFLAVVAEREEQAIQASDQLKLSCQWSKGHSLPNKEKLTEWLQSAPSKVSVVAAKGMLRGSKGTHVSATYSRPFQAHASISPSMAMARKDKNGLTVWSHTQGIYPVRGAIAKLVNLKEEQVHCIHEQASGCYGHNGADDAAADAAIIAMHLPGKAIRLQYSRDDEFRWEPYGSAMAMQVEAVLNNDGNINDWQYHVWSCTHTTRPSGARGAGNLLSASLIERAIPQPPARTIGQPYGGADRNAVPLYVFPNMSITKHFITEMPMRVSALRTLGAYANVFSIESFMDELSDLAGADPFDFRIKHLKDKRAIAVLEKLRQVSNWSAIEVKASEGKGIGFARYKNSSAYTAVAFFVSVDKTAGDIKLEKAVSVTDAGQVINPDGLKNQIEGGIIQAASWTLKEQVNFTREQVVSLDWSGYPILRFSEVPEMETHLIDRPDEPSLGGGESSQGPSGAALANAVANALRSRLRDIPFTRERVRAASV